MYEPFRFKQFALRHGAGLKVTTDAVFFGAWAPLNGTGPLVDIGAGTGLLGLMAAQRFPGINSIHLLESQEQAAIQAAQNAKASPWANRIQAIQAPVEDFTPTLSYADILMNPPFFVDSLKRHKEALNHALHADTGLLERWIRLAQPWLAPEGRLHLMALPEARLPVLKLSLKIGLHLAQEGFLHHSPNHDALRWVATLAQTEGTVPRRPIWYIKDEHGQLDPDYKKLVEPFYLNF